MTPACADGVLCTCCGRLYEASKGCPSIGIPAGTPWEDIPMNWRCPDCGAGRSSFESVEVIYQKAYCVLAEF
ncbi:rubredoxin [Dyella sp. C11]|uniref:rubredoxin n=1 Tax=Dyella sp. C11 TaxID=2126991 RepID=UPI000D64DD54|nr:rubredoxin [Dyella sp. C11]